MKVKKILVSQPKPTGEKSPYYEIAERYGFEIVFRPFIKVEGIDVKEFRQQRINLSDYTAVIFTARTAVDHFFRICELMRVQVPEAMKYFCVTEAIALYLQKYIVFRKRKVFFGVSGKLDDLVPFIQKNSTETFLLPISDPHKDEVHAALDNNDLKYTKAVMYRTVSNDFSKDEPFDYDMLIFFSPTGISSLKKNFPEYVQGDTLIGCFGATTAKAVKDAGLRLDLEAPTSEAPSMTSALDLFMKNKQNKQTNH